MFWTWTTQKITASISYPYPIETIHNLTTLNSVEVASFLDHEPTSRNTIIGANSWKVDTALHCYLKVEMLFHGQKGSWRRRNANFECTLQFLQFSIDFV